jgi:lipid A 3-O-deacylase
MKPVRALLVSLAALLCAGTAAAEVRSEWMAAVGRAAEGKDIDLLRLYYRRALTSDPRWWWPTHVQFGAGIWQVPDLGGTTQRFDVSATPVWRADYARTYVEAGIGVYLLSHTINNDTTHLPTSFEFGSHVGAGLRVGARREATVGIALQHLSNAGIKQPNGGVNFVLLNASFPF